jgi:acyl carrier protein
MEVVLKQIWCKVLDVGSVSSSSNFFLEGGDSMKLVALAIEIKKALAIEVPLLALFEAQSFGGLAAEVRKRAAEA